MDNAFHRLNGVTVYVNDEALAVKADSVSYRDGAGAYTQEAADLGNGAVENVFSVDTSTKKGAVKFEVPAIQKYAELVRAWKNNLDSNVVKLVKPGFTRTGLKMAMINDPDITLSKEGSIAVEFEGCPLK